MDVRDDVDERKPVILRLTPAIKARLQADARRNRRSMNAHAEALFDEHTPPLDGEPTRAVG